MKSEKNIAIYRRLRSDPLWRLLAANHGPVFIALLQTYLLEEESSIPASILHERLHRDLEELRGQGEDLPQTSQAYVADWLSSGYIERRFPAGASEEEYEISSAGAKAIRFVTSLVDPRKTATESRLTGVIQQLVSLADATDSNPQTRIAKLKAERAHIDREIEAIQQGKFVPLKDERALERIREIITLADDLTGDFRRVRDEFEQLNRDLRQRLLDNEGNRGEILDAVFTGVDLITESEAGKTFSAFWRLLNDPEQSATFEQALEEVLTRNFAHRLDIQERRFLISLTRALLKQGDLVHEVLQHFARSLKHFVQSREFLEQRRLNQLLKEAQSAALSLKEEVKTTDTLEYQLQLTSSRLFSLAQWVLFDPALNLVNKEMSPGEVAAIDISEIRELVAQSEIDFRTLETNIQTILEEYPQISIGEILHHFPATQGLGSVVGYLLLGSKNGIHLDETETIGWTGNDGQLRSARIPAIYFLRN